MLALLASAKLAQRLGGVTFHMFKSLIPLAALLASVFILLLGNGLHGTVVPIRAGLENFSSLSIGFVGASYYLGYVAGCLWSPYAVKRVGHIRAFTVMASVASSAILAQAILLDENSWILLRFVTGFCFAGLYVVIESWLNERSSGENRGQILSIYQITNLVALTLGQQLLNVASTSGFILFALSSILISVALVPVALTTSMAPAPLTKVRLRPGWVFKTSPVGAIGCLAVGFVSGAFWSLAPIYAQGSNLSISEIAVFMSVTIVGGAISQWPLGRLSDVIDRRYVVLVCCFGGAVSGIVMAIFGASSNNMLLALSFFFGCFSFPLYSVCVAHANDYVSSDDFVTMSAGLLLIFGIGAVIGPVLGSFLVSLAGQGMLFVFTASVHLLMAVFTIARIYLKTPVPAAERDNFAHLAGAMTAEALSVDPRSTQNIDQQSVVSADVIQQESVGN